MMKNNKLKAGQKLINPSKDDLYVHPYARAALCVWQRLRPKAPYIDMKFLDNFYRPPLRLVEGKNDVFYFFNDFERVDQVLRFENDSDYPCLIIPESINDIQQLAWREVVSLIFLKGVNHPDLFKVLKNNAPQSVICQLMRIKYLTVKEYCRFARISQSNYEYQQCKFASEERVIGMPKSMDWLSDAR